MVPTDLIMVVEGMIKHKVFINSSELTSGGWTSVNVPLTITSNKIRPLIFENSNVHPK